MTHHSPKTESAIAEGLSACPPNPLAFYRAAAYLDRLQRDPTWTEADLAAVRVGILRGIVFRYLAKLAS